MNQMQEQLKLQAHLDNELSPGEAREVAERLARDPEAAALLRELKQTSECLAGFEEGVKLPESREFYWSKIQRELQRLEKPAATPSSVPFMTWLRRLLVPAAGVAVVALVCLISLRSPSGSGPALHMRTAAADSNAFVYHDYSAGATLVWLSFPADNDVVDGDEVSTID